PTLITTTATLTRANLATHGGLAVNLGLLARALPKAAPSSLAVSFALFDNHLADLRATIDARLAAHTRPFADPAAVMDDLTFVRDLVVSSPLDATDLAALTTAIDAADL